MKLNANSVATDSTWKEKGYYIPTFNQEDMIKKTVEAPEWVHFGAGNIFRAFQANLAQRMLDGGLNDKGLTVVEGFDYEIIEKMYRPHDNLSLLVTLKADGSVEKSVIASIAESCILDSNDDKEFNRLKEIFRCDSLQLATFTITEKGYSLVNPAGELLAAVKDDFVNGPSKPQSYIGKVAALLYERFLAGEKKIAMVSTDNCSHNGDKLFDAVHAFAKEWTANGKAEAGFVAYIEDDSKVSFPWSMIDKITPRPDDSVNEILKNDGVEELEPVVTSKKTWVAPFVNAEESEYLVIEDKFPNGRPALEKVGVIFTEKETVDKVERMKVCTCLNPLHTALAVYGCLLGYDKISEEMKDEELVKLVKTIGYVEGLPVVTDPGVIKPQEFIDTVVNVRIPNKFMPDTPQRIATDTSQKLAIRFGETIKAYMASDKLNVADLKCIPLVHAGWLRYLMGVDDNGNNFEPSPDPLLEKAQAYVKDIELGGNYDKETLKSKVLPLLKDATIFGTDLEAAGLSDIIIGYFEELIAGTGAVRETLKKHV
ncbi:MAG: mannitol dehydrogenase family protein [Butyrivibrio sp.]|uniref:Fructuronate reductase n=1 Tax=Butyrivibrio hungatei TaxID=185008 RepID=A0A1G5FYA8_9FIRM|nr:mannitol dehydrogenase family protein [Butyrivibrio hungatei]MBR4358764.1 mannitol dehydrogenase family protein [Butyrivibrio sp.]MBR4639682.1 mannitol dehydrogenase family protein [Butyrivibrio sp.]MEE3469820.1 mannitol dehydrogenase family protein [Butyrivibrio hungatei]SCY44295.1 fructuronate reductase [Butyrivibrio hungatei]